MGARVVIVGGGIAGLCAARELLRRDPDLELVILEAGTHAGGLVRTELLEGYLCEYGPNGWLASGEASGSHSGSDGSAIALARTLGIDVVPAQDVSKRRWIFRNGKLNELPMGPAALIRSSLLSARGKLRLLAEPFLPRRTQGDESIADFARGRLGEEAAEALVAPMVTGIYAGDAGRLSVASALPRLHGLEQRHGSLVRGMVAMARQGRQRPRLTTWTPLAGAGALPAALAGSLGNRLRLGERAVRVSREGSGLVVHTSMSSPQLADAVVFALPPASTAPLVSEWAPDLAMALQGFESASVVLAHLGFRREDVVHPLDGFGFISTESERMRVLGCVFESSLFPGRAPEGHVLLRCICGGARFPDFGRGSDPEILHTVRGELQRALGIERQPRFHNVVRLPNAIPQAVVGHAGRVAAAQSAAREAGVILAGNAYAGVAVNDVVFGAAKVADDVEAALGRRRADRN